MRGSSPPPPSSSYNNNNNGGSSGYSSRRGSDDHYYRPSNSSSGSAPGAGYNNNSSSSGGGGAMSSSFSSAAGGGAGGDNSCRVYIGNLSPSARHDDVVDHFRRCGKIANVTIKSNYAFVDFENRSEVDYACSRLNQSTFCGRRILVEEARGKPRDASSYYDDDRRGRGGYDSRRDGGYDSRRGGSSNYSSGGYVSSKPSMCSKKLDYRVLVLNLPRDCDWSKLKDHMKVAGVVNYTDCHNIIDTVGIVEFDRSSSIKEAVKMFNNSEFMGSIITVIDPKDYVKDIREKSLEKAVCNDDNESYVSVDSVSNRSHGSKKSSDLNHHEDDDNKSPKSPRTTGSESRSKTPVREQQVSSPTKSNDGDAAVDNHEEEEASANEKESPVPEKRCVEEPEDGAETPTKYYKVSSPTYS